MALIFETENFRVLSAGEPHVSREEGGHIVIYPKRRVADRTGLTSEEAQELMNLTIVVGRAFPVAMKKQGVDIGRINYQDMGNWGVFEKGGPTLHVHIYGRAKDAKIQKYGEALNLPSKGSRFYENFKPLSDADVAEIQKEIKNILKSS